MKFTLFVILILLTSCSRTFVLSKRNPGYERSLTYINKICGKKECQVTVLNGFTFLTDSLAIVNDTLFYKTLTEDSLQDVAFNQVTSIYYKDHWAGFAEGGMIGLAIGGTTGYLLNVEYKDFNGSSKTSRGLGACCLGSLGFIAGATYGSINGLLKIYEVNDDSLSPDSADKYKSLLPGKENK